VGEAAALAKELSLQFQTHLTPFAAVAAELLDPAAVQSISGGDNNCSNQTLLSACAGRAFCFLPLPVSTGLPVAVNGYFELSSNRRDVWHGEDMAGAGAARARWNAALLRLVAAPAYVALLHAAARELGPGPAYSALWPATAVAAPWQIVVSELYRLTASQPLVWSRAAGAGRWMAPAECVFFPFALLQLEQDGQQQQQQQQSPDKQQKHKDRQSKQQAKGGAEGHAAAESLTHLLDGLLGLGVPLPDVPRAVASTMQQYMVSGAGLRRATFRLRCKGARATELPPALPAHPPFIPNPTQIQPKSTPKGLTQEQATPSFVRRSATTHPDPCTSLQRATQVTPLLRYALSDIDISTPQGLAQLFGVRLLPLADGKSLAAVGPTAADSATSSSKVYVASEQLELLLVQSQVRLLLDHTLVGAEVTAQLSVAAAQHCSTLRCLDVAALVEDFLPAILPDGWRRGGMGRVAGAGGSPSKEGAGQAAAEESPVVTW